MWWDVKAAQTAEIDRMQGWLQDWYGVTHEPEITRGDMRRMERLASLSGAEFEIQFMKAMSKHHRSAIRRGETCLGRASHAALIDLCENIIATQRAEIAKMEDWLCHWYGHCRSDRNARTTRAEASRASR